MFILYRMAVESARNPHRVGFLNWKVTYRKGVYTILVVCKQNFQTSHVNGEYSRSLVYNFFIGVRSQVRLKLKEQSTKIARISCQSIGSTQSLLWYTRQPTESPFCSNYSTFEGHCVVRRQLSTLIRLRYCTRYIEQKNNPEPL